MLATITGSGYMQMTKNLEKNVTIKIGNKMGKRHDL